MMLYARLMYYNTEKMYVRGIRGGAFSICPLWEVPQKVLRPFKGLILKLHLSINIFVIADEFEKFQYS